MELTPAQLMLSVHSTNDSFSIGTASVLPIMSLGEKFEDFVIRNMFDYGTPVLPEDLVMYNITDTKNTLIKRLHREKRSNMVILQDFLRNIGFNKPVIFDSIYNRVVRTDNMKEMYVFSYEYLNTVDEPTTYYVDFIVMKEILEFIK